MKNTALLQIFALIIMSLVNSNSHAQIGSNYSKSEVRTEKLQPIWQDIPRNTNDVLLNVKNKKATGRVPPLMPKSMVGSKYKSEVGTMVNRSREGTTSSAETIYIEPAPHTQPATAHGEPYHATPKILLVPNEDAELTAMARKKMPYHSVTDPLVIGREDDNEEAYPKIKDQAILISEKSSSEPYIVALLLPLSGKYQTVGKALMQAAEMAVFESSGKTGTPPITLKPYDTAGNAANIGRIIDDIRTDGPSLIIGPLLSKTSRALSSNISGVPILSLSNDADLANTGALVMGFTPEQQVKRVMDYAFTQGIVDYAALLPDNPLGVASSNAFLDSLKAQEVSPLKLEWYGKPGAAMSESIKRIIGTGDKEAPVQSKALLIPSGGDELITIARRVYRKGIAGEQFRPIGSGAWDQDSVLKEPRLFGGWFASSPPQYRSSFETLFQQSYGYKPPRIAALAYDAVGIAISLVDNRSDSSPFSWRNFTSPAGFETTNGILKFSESGISQRALAVLEVTSDGFEVIDPARMPYPVINQPISDDDALIDSMVSPN